ncbi:hypothetical protein [Psychrobacillus lasiicapitis]|uniref:hypothetical protein n=1 Tax=Psychrobacillus lasiicapitis TaxID=1636719 RepID=UPI001476A647|nr:hypothetical protein [Psychrobacillus lasiicapitis]GGA31126.1 hypothetical protein GCM10011384_20780 [Psychrobacillus lasiicapitis]
MAEKVQIEKDGKVLEVTEKAYEVVYKAHGYKLHEKTKPARKKQGVDDEAK